MSSSRRPRLWVTRKYDRALCLEFPAHLVAYAVVMMPIRPSQTSLRPRICQTCSPPHGKSQRALRSQVSHAGRQNLRVGQRYATVGAVHRLFADQLVNELRIELCPRPCPWLTAIVNIDGRFNGGVVRRLGLEHGTGCVPQNIVVASATSSRYGPISANWVNHCVRAATANASVSKVMCVSVT